MLTLAERVAEVCVEVPRVAVSPGLTGAIPPDQLVPVFQSAEAGAFSQVASTASKEEGRSKKETKKLPPGQHRADDGECSERARADSPIKLERKRRSLPASIGVIFFRCHECCGVECLRARLKAEEGSHRRRALAGIKKDKETCGLPSEGMTCRIEVRLYTSSFLIPTSYLICRALRPAKLPDRIERG